MRRHKASLSNYRLLTGEPGLLYPLPPLEVLPHDTVELQTKLLVRVTPLAAPVYHQMDVRVHHWYVKNRILADNHGHDWEDFITGGEDGLNVDTVPTLTSTNAKDLLDYMGLPKVAGIEVNAYPVRAFNMIWNEFYKDTHLGTERLPEDLTIPRIAWQKDYFTTARPWSSLGPEISIPLGDSAPIVTVSGLNQPAVMNVASTDSPIGTQSLGTVSGGVVDAGGSTVYLDPKGTLEADLENAAGANPIEFREAFALQTYAENRARYGARYTEYMAHAFGITQANFNKPIYLGGGTSPINFSEVMQTAPEASGRDFGVGDMYGHGIVGMKSQKFRKFFTEHGYIISVISVRPKTMYQDGIQRHWLYQDKEDYYTKELANIGQQGIYQDEIYADAGNGSDLFGFQNRYSQLLYQPSGVSGEFRDTLDYWHLGRQLGSSPTLNGAFIDCVPDNRIYNDTNSDPLWIMAHNQCVARRVAGVNKPHL